MNISTSINSYISSFNIRVLISDVVKIRSIKEGFPGDVYFLQDKQRDRGQCIWRDIVAQSKDDFGIFIWQSFTPCTFLWGITPGSIESIKVFATDLYLLVLISCY